MEIFRRFILETNTNMWLFYLIAIVLAGFIATGLSFISIDKKIYAIMADKIINKGKNP